MRDDIPLQTPMGNYRPSLWRRYRPWVFMLGTPVALFLIAGVIASYVNRVGPLRISATFATLAGIHVEPNHISLQAGKKDIEDTATFSVTNKSTVSIHPYFYVTQRSNQADKINVDLLLHNDATPLEAPVIAGKVQTNYAVIGYVDFALEATTGLAPDGTIAAGSSATFALSARNQHDQKGEPAIILIVITQARANGP